jgi:hypothetical protein
MANDSEHLHQDSPDPGTADRADGSRNAGPQHDEPREPAQTPQDGVVASPRSEAAPQAESPAGPLPDSPISDLVQRLERLQPQIKETAPQLTGAINALPSLILLCLTLPLTACASGNVRTANSYSAPPSPAVIHPSYDPYPAYGEANATWRPPVVDRNGTIVKPAEPSTQGTRPDYEHSTWASGAGGGSLLTPPGTF